MNAAPRKPLRVFMQELEDQRRLRREKSAAYKDDLADRRKKVREELERERQERHRSAQERKRRERAEKIREREAKKQHEAPIVAELSDEELDDLRQVANKPWLFRNSEGKLYSLRRDQQERRAKVREDRKRKKQQRERERQQGAYEKIRRTSAVMEYMGEVLTEDRDDSIRAAGLDVFPVAMPALREAVGPEADRLVKEWLYDETYHITPLIGIDVGETYGDLRMPKTKQRARVTPTTHALKKARDTIERRGPIKRKIDDFLDEQRPHPPRRG